MYGGGHCMWLEPDYYKKVLETCLSFLEMD